MNSDNDNELGDRNVYGSVSKEIAEALKARMSPMNLDIEVDGGGRPYLATSARPRVKHSGQINELRNSAIRLTPDR